MSELPIASRFLLFPLSLPNPLLPESATGSNNTVSLLAVRERCGRPISHHEKLNIYQGGRLGGRDNPIRRRLSRLSLSWPPCLLEGCLHWTPKGIQALEIFTRPRPVVLRADISPRATGNRSVVVPAGLGMAPFGLVVSHEPQ